MKAKLCLLTLIWLVIISEVSLGEYFEHNVESYPGILTHSRGEKELNTYILREYDIIAYGRPFGSISDPDNLNIGWLKKEGGLMTKGNESTEKGEYKYLGYNFDDEPITNDRYFLGKDKTGKVFDLKYSGVTWLKVPGALVKWTDVELRRPTINQYILKSLFWDSDHITAGEEPTGYSIESFCREKGINHQNYALILTEPTVNTTGTVKFEYIRNSDGKADYNTVEIPPLPHIKGYLKAYSNIKHIEAGKKEDVVVTLDTTGSYVLLNNQESEDITKRTYWAATGTISGAGYSTTGSSVQITVPQVSPNETIKVQVTLYSREVAALDMEDVIPSTVTLTADIFIGEIPALPPLDYTRPHAQGVIKADERDREAYDVGRGIPSSETVYTQVISEDYLYRMAVHPVSGSVSYSVTVNHVDSEGKPKTTHVSVPKYYTYWEITSFELFALKESTLKNNALPGGKVTLSPSGLYRAPAIDITHDPGDRDSYHVNTGTTSYTVSSSAITTIAEAQAVAESMASSPSVRNDKLVINGKVIMDPYSGIRTSQLVPEKTSRDVLYAPNILIPGPTRNGLYNSQGTITYERVYSYNPTLTTDTLTNDLEEANPVLVHTPVCVEATVSSDDAHNQKPNKTMGASSLVLGRPFTVDISNRGTHLGIKGYGTRDYTPYLKDREICFDFDTYWGTDMGGTYLKAGEWHSLGDLGITTTQNTLTFYTPTWVDEGLYHMAVRNIALNDSSNGSNIENRANLSSSRTVASVSKPVEVSGRVYDFAITDIDDLSWELFFRQAKGKADATGKTFFVGPNNINGDRDPRRTYFLPVMPGKNDVQGYQLRAVKLGYAFKFEVKTMGNYYDPYDFIRIMPSFTFVDKEGKNRQEIDLYYSAPGKPLIRIGSTEDTQTMSMKLDFKYRGIDPMEFVKTAAAMFRLRGGITGYTLDQWKETFPKVSQNGVTFAKYHKILLSEPLRSFVGPERGVPEGVNQDKALASVQKWYGEYRLPPDCLAVPKGTDLSKLRNLTRSSPVFLKDGFILVNFRDIAVINDDQFTTPSLQYSGGTGNGWALEGYSLVQKGWQLLEGDILAYYVDQRATDDYMGAGTH